jgi:hypothetical protein
MNAIRAKVPDPDATAQSGRRLRLTAFVALAVMLLAGPPAHGQVGVDRPGGDYSTFVVRSGDPAACANRCERDNRCRAWSFAYPATVGPRALCWLKNSVPARVNKPCCVSGVRGSGVTGPRGDAGEFEIDRIGGDYTHFDTPASATGSACAEACAKDTRCRAWTYSRPGYGTASARCYLKNRVTPPRHRPCCVSGVVR